MSYFCVEKYAAEAPRSVVKAEYVMAVAGIIPGMFNIFLARQGSSAI